MHQTSRDEKSLFNAARRIESAEARRLFLAQACGDDRELHARLEALLRVHAEHETFLQDPADELLAAVEHLTAETPGTVIGPYTLLRQIGEGGMGVVYLAEQARPVQRQVALKIIKPGMDSKQVVARFEAERQALALMDHPSIARVFETGTTAAGRAYFAMELVPGEPITRHADTHRLSVRQRLELFALVCQGVQHAHQKGVIHRDLKPSNVLVALCDAEPVPKIIDFGLAKAMGPKLTEETLVTQFGLVVGTPEHMSPEQADPQRIDIDTRSDIYALGVLLYELLTGTTPLQPERMRQCGLLEMLRLVREAEPPAPSVRLAACDDLPAIASKRGVEPKKLVGLMRGELDWIVMKCLEKDPARRYQTAQELALDVRRYLTDEPVAAGPPSAGYRARKFLRRHRGPVLAASLVLLALIGGMIGTSVGMWQAVQAQRAEARRAEGERLAKVTAQKRLEQIEKGIDVLGTLFGDLDPRAEEKDGRPLRAILGDRLDKSAAALEAESVGDPLVVARLQDRLGRTYLGLGRPAQAEALFAKAVAIRAAELGPDDPLTLVSLTNLAQACRDASKTAESIRRYEQVRDTQMRVLAPDDPAILATMEGLASAYCQAGETSRGVALLEQVRDARLRHHGRDDPRAMATQNRLVVAYIAARRHTDAIALGRQILDIQQTRFGADDIRTLAAVHNLANAYRVGFRMKDALALLEQARDTVGGKLGPDHPETLRILDNLARTYWSVGRTSKAIALAEPVLEKRTLTLGLRHRATLFTLDTLGLAHQGAARPEKALTCYRQSAAGVEALGFAHEMADAFIANLCGCLEELKQYEEAEGWRRKLLPVIEAKAGAQSDAYTEELAGLGSNLLVQKKYTTAAPILHESLSRLRKKQPARRLTFLIQSRYGGALLGQKKYADAEPMLREGYLGLAKLAEQRTGPLCLAPTSENLNEALERLVQLYEASGNQSEAERWRSRAR